MTDTNVRSDALEDRADRDDTSQDPAQPAVGPAIQFQELIVPDDEPVTIDNEYGEIIDHNEES